MNRERRPRWRPATRETMQCRTCGTEIAEKALICYRCGAAVNEPVTRPPASRPLRRRPLTVGVVLILGILAFALSQWTDSAMVTGAVWLIFGVIAIVLLWTNRRTAV